MELSRAAEIPAPNSALRSPSRFLFHNSLTPLPCAVGKASRLVTLLWSLDCHNFNFVPELKELEGLNECFTFAFLY